MLARWRWLLALTPSLLLAAALAGTAHATPIFLPLDMAGTNGGGTVQDISGDGRVAVGTQSGRAAVWSTEDNSFTLLPEPTDPGLIRTKATGTSYDGSVVVGTATYQLNHNPGCCEALVWREGETEPIGLGSIPGHDAISEALGVSGDGTRVVGEAERNGQVGFVWFGAGPIQAIGDPGTIARAISADGRVIVGSTNGQLFRWVEGEGSTIHPEAHTPAALTADGSTVFGSSYPLGGFYLWTESAGLELLPNVPAGATSVLARDISGDGSVLAGSGRYDNVDRALVSLDSGNEFVDLQGYLESMGVDLTDWTLSQATSVSHDGRVIGGYGRRSGQSALLPWVVRLPEPSAALLLAVAGLWLGWKHAR